MKSTRCPACLTVFRVSAEQLEARQGRVRCGQCAHVFDARASLVDLAPVAALEEEVAASVETTPSAPATLPIQVALFPEPVAAEEVIPHSPVLDNSPSGVEEDLLSLPPFQAISAEPMWKESAFPDAPALDSGGTGPSLDETPPPPHLRPAHVRNWPWSLGIALLLLAAIGQGAYVFRTDLAMNYPSLRPQFSEWCRNLGCDLPLPRKADLIGIEASELRPAPQDKNLLQLVATLRNRANFPQAYPHLELSLTDTEDKPLVRRVFPPREYLPAKVDVAAGFPGGGDLPLSLTLDPTSLVPAGYRVYVFYP